MANVDHPDVLISVNGIHKLKEISFTDDGLVVGAAVTLSELEQQLTESIKCVAAGLSDLDSLNSCLIFFIRLFSS